MNRTGKNCSSDVQDIIVRTTARMREWGITVSFLAGELGVSRQYAWQIVHCRTFVSAQKAGEIAHLVEGIITRRRHMQSFGDRLRAARLASGFTLKQVAERIGYSWVGVERWEKDVCRPKPGVLWHLFSLYGIQTGADPDGIFSRAHDLRLAGTDGHGIISPAERSIHPERQLRAAGVE